MKKILLSSFVFFAALGLIFLILRNSDPYFASKLLNRSACDTPIPYRIGRVDSRFNINRGEFINKIGQDANLWSNIKGKTLFVYDPKGALEINLLFDDKQYLTTRINELEQKLKNEKTSIDVRIEEYQKRLSDFKRRSKSLSESIFYWNSKGGAPTGEYEKLIAEQENLIKEADTLNAIRKELNQTTGSFNEEIKTLNQTVNSFNNVIKSKPEEGLYNSKEKRIDIFFFNNDIELNRTIIHELGHALGLPHVDNPDALMYFRTTDKIEPTADDIKELLKVCRNYTPLEFIRAKILLIGDTVIDIGRKSN